MSDSPTRVAILYNEDHSGTLSVTVSDLETPVWARLKLAIRTKKIDHTISGGEIRLAWTDTLSVVRELGSKSSQKSLNFRFIPEGQALVKLRSFANQIKKTRFQRNKLVESISPLEIEKRLRVAGFVKRELKPFQLRDLAHLLSLKQRCKFLGTRSRQDNRNVCTSYSHPKPLRALNHCCSQVCLPSLEGCCL